ncbi:MFS transporter [Saccharolobus solfataricus]|uniref:Metabolite transport protein n=3 Tax=Saccharolobus solfataricus TaxID=2287 RepID=Q97VT2_SACS2|nr:MFS transporter [Saccharolobus solfataricus]AAK42658.1 Metabolite transport protein [Saccharolobus solfataricus P2]AKA72754.1 MFS transporter [Saccharolobus solfataricus]AKA75453.1 MFS transporter [Saccharolobus solfataricus]AKA78146.1 MFS transporter [Saccharolobus solfataricus]AZF67265.1 MFS transporter [Saccharolobus solfataricus]
MKDETKVSIAAMIGIAFEFYDFLIFGFVSSILASLFFPSTNKIVSLLDTLAVFATGFAGRPLGAIVFGHLGDKIGRKYTLIVTMSLMGLSSLFTGLLPSYAVLGILAPTLLTVLRLLQGFSLGGEFGGGITLSAEFAKPTNRAFYIGIAQMAQGVGPLMATGLIFIFSSIMSPPAFASTGWRILFIIGAFIAVIGVIIRLKISESPVFKNVREMGQISKFPLAEAFRLYWKRILLGLGFIIGGTTLTYATSVFAASYLETVIGVPAKTVSLALTIGYIVEAICILAFSLLADKIGRKPMMITTAVGLLILVYPYFYLISTGQFSLILLAQILYSTIGSFSTAAYAAALTELFPTKVRYTALSFDYHVGVAVFGGTTPFIASYLIYATGYKLAPVYWGIAGMVITLIAYLLYKETKGTIFEGQERVR